MRAAGLASASGISAAHHVPHGVAPIVRMARRAGNVVWALPYAAIWSAVLVVVSRAADQTDCTGFCAVYTAWESYGVLCAAFLLSAVVALVQIVSLGRRSA